MEGLYDRATLVARALGASLVGLWCAVTMKRGYCGTIYAVRYRNGETIHSFLRPVPYATVGAAERIVYKVHVYARR